MKNIAVGLFLWSSLLGASPKTAETPLVLAWDVMPRSYDPRYAVDANSQYLENLLHCSLIEFNSDGQVEAGLAKEWKWLKPTVVEVTLRDDVKFADGSLVTAEAVKATYEFLIKGKQALPSPRSTAFKNVTSVSAGKNSVTFTLQEADAAFITNLVVGILPGAAASSDKVLTSDDRVKGCGPYVLEAVDIATIKLAANPHYSIKAPAKSKSVEIKAVKDENTCFLKLQKGEVDITQNNISLDKLSSISKQYPNLKVVHRPGINTTYIGFNTQDSILKNKTVRQAINVAIDRNAIIKFLLKDMAVPARTMLPPGNPFFNPGLPQPEYNPEKAKALLDQAGLKPGKDGVRFALTYKTTNNATRTAIAKTIASNLLQIGIKVTVQSLDWGKFKMDVDKGNVQMWSLSWVGFKDPDIFNYAFATENFPPNGGNRGRYSNASLDALLTKAKISVDPQVRKDLYGQVQSIIADEVPYVFLHHEENVAIMQKDIADYQVFADGRYSSVAAAYRLGKG